MEDELIEFATFVEIKWLMYYFVYAILGKQFLDFLDGIRLLWFQVKLDVAKPHRLVWQ